MRWVLMRGQASMLPAPASYYHREAAREGGRSTLEVVDLKQLKVDYQPLARAKLKVLASTVPSKRGAGKEETMKASMLMKTVAALTIGAAFPAWSHRRSASASTMTERLAIEQDVVTA